MTEVTASAPGKIMLGGEYAVIDGAEAVLMAVDRRAVARLENEPRRLSPFLEAAADAIAREVGGAAAERARRVVVDSEPLRAGDVKLGLGSSAAATVAAIGCALADGGDLDRVVVHRLAHGAHRAAQGRAGAPGSGADIATSVWGGLVVVRKRDAAGDLPLDTVPIHLPDDLQLVPVWTGAAADTATLVDRVRALRRHQRSTYDRATLSIADAVRDLVAAFERGSACAAVGALAAGGRAVAALGDAAGVALESPVHRKLRRLAERRGGAVKPTGAGAGDLALAAFDNAEAAGQFRRDVEDLELLCPALGVDREGVHSGLVPGAGAH